MSGVLLGTFIGTGLTAWLLGHQLTKRIPIYVDNELVKIKTISWYPVLPSASRIDLTRYT